MGIWSDYKENYTSCFPTEFFRTLSDKAANVAEQGSMNNWASFGWRSLAASPICAVSSTFGSLYAGARFGASVTYNSGSALKPLSYLTLGTLPLAIGITSGILATVGGLAAGAVATTGFAAVAAVSAVPVTAIAVVKAPFFIAGMCFGSNEKVEPQQFYAVPQPINNNPSRSNQNHNTQNNNPNSRGDTNFADKHQPKDKKDYRLEKGKGEKKQFLVIIGTN